MSVIFGVGVPLFFVVIICMTWSLIGDPGSDNSIVQPSIILPAISYMPILCIGVISLPICIFEYNQSNLLKRLQSSKITTFDFLVALLIYYFLLLIIVYFVNSGIATLILMSDGNVLKQIWATANWGGVFYTLVLTILICCGLGIVLGLFCKKYNQIQIIGITIVLINIFLGYWVMPLALVYAEPGGNLLNYISYSWIFSYISKMFTESWLQITAFNAFHSSIFDLSHVYSSSPIIGIGAASTTFVISSIIDKWLNLIFVALSAIGINIVAVVLYYRIDK